jgi:hypothetical protein
MFRYVILHKLRKQLNDSKPEIRKQAISEISKLSFSDSEDLILEVLGNEDDIDQLIAIILILRKYPSHKHIEPLMQMLERQSSLSEKESIRGYYSRGNSIHKLAGEVLGNMRVIGVDNPFQIQTIRPYLVGTNKFTKSIARQLLFNIIDKEAIPLLKDIFLGTGLIEEINAAAMGLVNNNWEPSNTSEKNRLYACLRQFDKITEPDINTFQVINADAIRKIGPSALIPLAQYLTQYGADNSFLDMLFFLLPDAQDKDKIISILLETKDYYPLIQIIRRLINTGWVPTNDNDTVKLLIANSDTGSIIKYGDTATKVLNDVLMRIGNSYNPKSIAQSYSDARFYLQDGIKVLALIDTPLARDTLFNLTLKAGLSCHEIFIPAIAKLNDPIFLNYLLSYLEICQGSSIDPDYENRLSAVQSIVNIIKNNSKSIDDDQLLLLSNLNYSYGTNSTNDSDGTHIFHWGIDVSEIRKAAKEALSIIDM